MVNVLKASKSTEPFSEEKFLTSVKRAGIPEKLHKDVLEHIHSKLYENIPSKEIYGHVIEFLGATDFPYTKSKYSLKQAIMDLGPTGYPFEDFVSEILTELGYSTNVRQILLGKCVSHEVDVIAEKDDKKILIEAKFHNSVGNRTDVRVPMYTKSRFEDLHEKHQIDEAWVITNTKATIDAIAYSGCVNMKIISWSYPDNGSLRDLIETSGLHPITILNTIPQHHKITLLNQHIVRCKTLHDNPEKLNELGIANEDKKKILEEIDFVCAKEHTNRV